jgi:hypothetical protein
MWPFISEAGVLTLHEADRAFGACWRRGNALWGVPAGKGAFHAVGAAAYAGRWAAFWTMSMPTSASIPRWVILPQPSLSRNDVLNSHCPAKAN